MSAYDTFNVVASIGALSNATRPLFAAPSDPNGGGITIVHCYVNQAGSTNSSLSLVKGTISASGVFTANGTLSASAVGGTAAPFAANAVQTMSLASDTFVDAGEFVAVVEGNVAAANAVALVNVAYHMGRK